MDKAEAEKLNDKIQAIYEKPLYEISSEEMDEAVIKLIIRTFNLYARRVSRERAIGFYTSRTPHLKDDKEILESVSENYDIWWKSNQEDKE